MFPAIPEEWKGQGGSTKNTQVPVPQPKLQESRFPTEASLGDKVWDGHGDGTPDKSAHSSLKIFKYLHLDGFLCPMARLEGFQYLAPKIHP